MAQKTYGIDFGTGTIKIYKKGNGIVILERNVVSTVGKENKPIAIGETAYEMYEKEPPSIHVSFPLQHGVIAHMQDMIASFHYSQSYLSGLRMLYAGVIMILVNVTGAALFTDISGKAFVSMVLVGSSSVFLFASVCVYACHKGAGGLFYAVLIAVWACVCVIARLAGTGMQMFLFTSVPLAVHGAVTAASFCLLFVSIGKVEKKDAYSFAC